MDKYQYLRSTLFIIFIFHLTANILVAQNVEIAVDANKEKFLLNPLMIGANMEDLHYQMTGGISSQLIHGESFFEPSLTTLAPQIGQIAGFSNCKGQWIATSGELTVNVTGINGPNLSPTHPIGIPGKNIGARLTSFESFDNDNYSIGASFWLPSDSQSSAGLIFNVNPNHSDNGWDWYSGYTVELEPSLQQVVLRRAARANQHIEVDKAACLIKGNDYTDISVQLKNGNIDIYVNNRKTISYHDTEALTNGLYGVITRENIRIKDFYLQKGNDKKKTISFSQNPLLTVPGDNISLRWSKIASNNVKVSYTLDTLNSWFKGKNSQKITFISGQGEAGIVNAGLKGWGINIKINHDYNGFIRVRTPSATTISLSLRSANNKYIYATKQIKTTGGTRYEKINFSLMANEEDPNGRFAITLTKPGEVSLGYVFLEPGEWGRYKGLPIRRDLAESIVDQGVKLLRLNGGMIERPDYRWKNMQGPRDERPPYDGFYDRYCSNGYGVIEHLNFCEAAGITPLVGLNIDETPASFADFVAYCNDNGHNPAARRRITDGHPKPYHIQYLQIANETKFNAEYAEKFKAIAMSIWAVDPHITLVTTGNQYAFKGTEDSLKVFNQLEPQLDIARFAIKNGKHIIFDCHAFNTKEDPAQCLSGNIPGAIAFSRWLGRLDKGAAQIPIGIYELNAGRFDYGRGLAHALEMNLIHANGDIIQACGMPNVSQPWGIFQTDSKAVLWTQGNIYYTPNKIWYQAAYYVDQMISKNWAPRVVSSTATGNLAVNVLAAKTDDRKHVVIRIVNTSKQSVKALIGITGLQANSNSIITTELSNNKLNTFNTIEQPEKIRPIIKILKVKADKFNYDIPPYSFVVMKVIETK